MARGRTESGKFMKGGHKETGLRRSEGKECVVRAGDIMLFRFNV